MADSNGHRPALRPANSGDLRQVLGWLKKEGSGFWNNRQQIEDGARDGDLTVAIKEDFGVIGFLLGSESGLAILEVRQKFWRTGIGRSLAEHGLRRIEEKGRIGVKVQCKPTTSVPFWERMGFSPTEETSCCLYYAYAFPKVFALPPGRPIQKVSVELRRELDTTPIVPGRFDRYAAEVEAGRLLLGERIAGYCGSGDAIVRVLVGERIVSERKAKYLGDVGVRYEDQFIQIDAISFASLSGASV
jgi:GNAT superfamily N-acetyltransferase